MGVSRDVMNRSRVAHRSEDILEHVTDAYYAVDAEWSVVYWNHAMELLSGVARDDACGVVLWDVLPDDVDSAFDVAHRRAFDSEHPHSADPMRLFGRWVSPRLVPDGDCLGVFLHEVRDDETTLDTATEALAETEVALKRSQQQVSVLESLLVDDVRSAMVEIRGTADLLVTELADETTRGDVQTIVEWGNEVLTLADEVWPLLDVLTECDDPEPHPIRLDDAVIDALTRTQVAFPDTTITGIVPEGVTVVADDLLTDVVESLVTEVIHATGGQPPAVHVSTTTEDGTATLTVETLPEGSVRSPDDETAQPSQPQPSLGYAFAETAVAAYDGTLRLKDRMSGLRLVLELAHSSEADTDVEPAPPEE